jgi:hypothetical protein
MYFWLLLKLYYCHDGSINKNLVKKTPIKNTKQKDLVKMVKSKLTCPKWHFGQVGHGGKKTIGGYFIPIFLVKKIAISCNDVPFDQIVKLVKSNLTWPIWLMGFKRITIIILMFFFTNEFFDNFFVNHFD